LSLIDEVLDVFEPQEHERRAAEDRPVLGDADHTELFGADRRLIADLEPRLFRWHDLALVGRRFAVDEFRRSEATEPVAEQQDVLRLVARRRRMTNDGHGVGGAVVAAARQFGGECGRDGCTGRERARHTLRDDPPLGADRFDRRFRFVAELRGESRHEQHHREHESGSDDRDAEPHGAELKVAERQQEHAILSSLHVRSVTPEGWRVRASLRQGVRRGLTHQHAAGTVQMQYDDSDGRTAPRVLEAT
jgi:hypothetical protein